MEENLTAPCGCVIVVRGDTALQVHEHCSIHQAFLDYALRCTDPMAFNVSAAFYKAAMERVVASLPA